MIFDDEFDDFQLEPSVLSLPAVIRPRVIAIHARPETQFQHIRRRLTDLFQQFPNLRSLQDEIHDTVTSSYTRSYLIVDEYGVDTFVLACAAHVTLYRQRVLDLRTLNTCIKESKTAMSKTASDLGPLVERCRLQLNLAPLSKRLVYTL